MAFLKPSTWLQNMVTYSKVLMFGKMNDRMARRNKLGQYLLSLTMFLSFFVLVEMLAKHFSFILLTFSHIANKLIFYLRCVFFFSSLSLSFCKTSSNANIFFVEFIRRIQTLFKPPDVSLCSYSFRLISLFFFLCIFKTRNHGK